MSQPLHKTAPDSQAQLISLPELNAASAAGPAVLAAGAGLLNGVKISLSVVVGAVHCTLGELQGMKEASVFKIDRHVDSPVDVVVNGSVIARGQLVVVDDYFGVRLTEIAQLVSA